MTPRFLRAAEIVLGHEGGFVDDPNDRGGKTKFGISQTAYPDEDIAALTWERARFLYHRDYWRPVRGDEIPADLALLVFDAAINSGPGQAIRWLQRAAGVTADGVFGPRTLAVAAGPGVALRFHRERAGAMGRMPTWQHHGRGWMVRMATLPFEAAEFARAG